ncbi:MAG TPA: O-antigen ligase family protein [Burkholderiaceae bacterium]|jgi:hypothetical protein
MEYLFVAYYYSLPYLMALGAAFALVFLAAFSVSQPLLPLLTYLGVFFSFSGVNWGSFSSATGAMYSRGSGQLFFPFVFWALVLGTFWAVMGRALAKQPRQPASSINRWFLMWGLLFILHLCWGLTAGVDIADMLNGDGFINVVWMGLLIAFMVASARNEKSISWLLQFIVVAGLLKSGYGLVRWAAFGGDPANVYSNVEKINIKLTYFDIVDSLVCVLAAATCCWQLFVNPPKDGDSLGWRVLRWAVVVLGIVCVLLSYRRTAWVGILMCGIYLFWNLRPSLRLVGIAIVLPIMTVAVGFFAAKRLGARAEKLGLLSFVYDLLSSNEGTNARTLELRLAFNSFVHSPIVGLGAWGRYPATILIPWQDPTRPGAFLHSGILHVVMKTGLVGLMLMLGVIASFVRKVRSMKHQTSEGGALVFAAICGMIFMLPDFLLGTPIPQFRTTQMIAFCLGLPFFVARAQQGRKSD